MSDSLSSFNDVETDPQSVSDQFATLCDNLLLCVEKLDESGFSTALSDEIGKELLSVKAALEFVECSQLYVDELIDAKKYISAHSDHRNVEVLRYCLQQLSRYISKLADDKQEYTTFLVSGFNEMAALRGKTLISDALLSVPDAYAVSFDSLRNFQQKPTQSEKSQAETNAHTTGDTTANNTANIIFSPDESYLEFSQLVLSVYRGQNRPEKLQQLGVFFEHLAHHVIDNKASAFWLACGAYVQTVNISSGELRPAVFTVFEQIEKIVMSVLAGDHNPVLGIQKSVDRLLCDVLSALYCAGYQGACLPQIDAEFEFASVLQILESQREIELNSSGTWLSCSAGKLYQVLQNCIEQLSDEELLHSEVALKDYLQKIKVLKLLLMLSGIHSARENLQEVEQYLLLSATAASTASSVTSLELVEQQMLYQFNFLEQTTEQTTEQNQAALGSTVSGISESVSAKAPKAQALSSPTLNVGLHASADQDDFGTQCNLCIDVIQQSLDTALGSSGNLMPDNSVISALTQLVEIVEDHGIDGLTDLLNPLAVFLAKAENTTLNQSETLLVQEAIIAATLGIDSLIGDKPMPELVMDVSARIESALSDGESRTAEDHKHSEAFDNFLNEVEELLPRLFELFQRWRGAPFASSRLHTDISRHLHSLKHSAEEVDETALATVVHYLEATMLDLRHTDAAPSQGFFDLAIESVEWLGDDIDRLRNNERSIDVAEMSDASSSDLVGRLKLASASDANDIATVDLAKVGASVKGDLAALVNKDSIHSDAPGLVIVGDQSLLTKVSGHSKLEAARHFQLADHSFKAVSRNQDRLVQLTKELNEAVESAGGSNTLKLRLLAAAFADVMQSQGGATNHLGLQLGAVSQIKLDTIQESLVKALTHAAEENSCRVQFKFESNGISLHRDLASGIQRALEPLLCSIIAGAFEPSEERASNGKPVLPTIEVSFKQSEGALVVQVTDDGLGVTVHGAEVQSNNPWKQTSKAGWAQFEMPRGIERPSAWANFEDTPIDISLLIDFAAYHGATVAVSGDESGSVYQLTLPQLVSVRDVIVVEVQQQQVALLASQVLQVSSWTDEKAMSLASLIGIKKKSAFGAGQSQSRHLVRCKTAISEHAFWVDNVVGHQSLEFSSADRLMPDVPGYLGAAALGGEGVVVLLDLDYWVGVR